MEEMLDDGALLETSRPTTTAGGPRKSGCLIRRSLAPYAGHIYILHGILWWVSIAHCPLHRQQRVFLVTSRLRQHLVPFVFEWEGHLLSQLRT